MRKNLLFDASSLIYALKQKKLDVLCDNYIQWLTIYEVINGLWKEAHLIKAMNVRDAINVAQILKELVSYMNVLSPHGHEEEILMLSLKAGITVYDASYVILANKYDLTLVTEDRVLRAKARDIIKTATLNEVIT